MATERATPGPRFPWVLVATMALVGAGIVACSDQGASGSFEIPPSGPYGGPSTGEHRDRAMPGVGYGSLDASRGGNHDAASSGDAPFDAVEDVPSESASDVGAAGDGAGDDATGGEGGAAGDAATD